MTLRRRASPALLFLALAVLALAGCEGERLQSMLHPRGPDAARIATLWWVMFWVYGGVLVVTLLVLAWALVARRRDRAPVGGRFVLVTGVALPTLILVAMLVYTVRETESLPPEETALTVRVTGHMWWWEVEYPDLGIVDANEIHVPAGVPVRIELISQDVVHSFWVPNLNGKMDMLPEHVNEFWLQADLPGRYRGQCAEYCGVQHAWMAFWVVAHEPAAFERWAAEKREAAERAAMAEAADPQLLRGLAVYNAAGCATCHRIEGVSDGLAGPDLTHVGGRLTIGGGVLENTRGNLAGWIANPQPIKPGVLMPPAYLPPDDLLALTDYLRSLE